MLPLGHSGDGGRFCHWQPVRRTNAIPSRHCRSSLGGRPPLGDALCGGNIGAIVDHNASGTLTLNMATSLSQNPCSSRNAKGR